MSADMSPTWSKMLLMKVVVADTLPTFWQRVDDISPSYRLSPLLLLPLSSSSPSYSTLNLIIVVPHCPSSASLFRILAVVIIIIIIVVIVVVVVVLILIVLSSSSLIDLIPCACPASLSIVLVILIVFVIIAVVIIVIPCPIHLIVEFLCWEHVNNTQCAVHRSKMYYGGAARPM